MRLNEQTPLLLAGIWAAIFAIRFVDGFTIPTASISSTTGFEPTSSRRKLSISMGQSNGDNGADEDSSSAVQSRREMMTKTVALASASLLPAVFGSPEMSSAAVGTLPEFSETNAIVQGLTINVADASQQKLMIEFLLNSFSFEIQRQRIQDTVEETVSILNEFGANNQFLIANFICVSPKICLLTQTAKYSGLGLDLSS